MSDSRNKRQSDFTPLQGFILLVIVFYIILAVLVIRTQWNLSFGFSSPELGILLTIIFILVMFIPSEKKKSGQ